MGVEPPPAQSQTATPPPPTAPPQPQPQPQLRDLFTTSRIKIATFVLWCVTFGLTLISLIILATNDTTVYTIYGYVRVEFHDVYSYRYMMATIVFGMLYALLQMVFKFYSFNTRKSIIAGDGGLLFDFYGDKVISYFMATGAAAGFGATKDLQGSDSSSFYDKGYASASLLLLAFFCSAIISIFSSYALPRNYI